MRDDDRRVWTAWLRSWAVDLLETVILGVTAGIGIGLGVLLIAWGVLALAGVR